jgi:uncharacterized protein (TIRG00374 family)
LTPEPVEDLPGGAPVPAGARPGGRKPKRPRSWQQRLVTYVAIGVVALLVVHLVAPALAGLRHTLTVLEDADWRWLVAALLASAISLACYVAVFHLVTTTDPPADTVPVTWGSAYQISMASQAASTVITAGGAGGIALIIWALGRLGVDRVTAGVRVFCFLVCHYAIYVGALIVFGLGIYLGILPGHGPTSLTLVPAIVGIVLWVVTCLIALGPDQIERRLASEAGEGRMARALRGLQTVPAVFAGGVQLTARILRTPGRGTALIASAIGYWAANIAVLALCFHAFGHPPVLTALVQAYFVGMTANLLPLLPGGVGSVEAGMGAALLAFGEPGPEVIVSVLAYRLLSFWIPTVPEAIAYFQLRRTLDRTAPVGG